MTSFTRELDTPVFKGKVDFPTGVYINGKFTAGSDNTTINIINPTNGEIMAKVAEATPKDVDLAVEAAQKAFDTTWGLHAPGTLRAKLLNKLASLMEEHHDKLSAVEATNNGKTFNWAKYGDIAMAIETVKYYAGWADKIQGKTIETSKGKLAYTRHEPIGVVGQIVAWNFPILLMCWKIAPALACGNTIVFKPSEFTPLSALYLASLTQAAGFPPGVLNVVTGTGPIIGEAISSHMGIEKISFTGSTKVGRRIMECASKSNLKNVTLELGGKSPNVIFNDADVELAVGWTSHGIFWSAGQACAAGSRIYVQSGIYDKFLKLFTEKTQSLKLGDPFSTDAYQGPVVSKEHYDRVMGYIASGKADGATVYQGGERHGDAGYWIQPTIFTDVKADMKIVKEEIFGPVGVVIKFEDEDDVVRQANDTVYGLAAAIFTQDISRAMDVSERLKAGTVWINSALEVNAAIPFGGYKQSGIGRDLGEYALSHYTNVKAVHVNIGNARI